MTHASELSENFTNAFIAMIHPHISNRVDNCLWFPNNFVEIYNEKLSDSKSFYKFHTRKRVTISGTWFSIFQKNPQSYQEEMERRTVLNEKLKMSKPVGFKVKSVQSYSKDHPMFLNIEGRAQFVIGEYFNHEPDPHHTILLRSSQGGAGNAAIFMFNKKMMRKSVAYGLQEENANDDHSKFAWTSATFPPQFSPEDIQVMLKDYILPEIGRILIERQSYFQATVNDIWRALIYAIEHFNLHTQ